MLLWCYGYHIGSKEALMQAENDDLDRGQRSPEVKWGKLCSMATIFGQKSADASWEWWWPLWRSEVIRGQMGKLCDMATIFGQKNRWCKLRLMMTFTEVKGHQRSNVVKYVLWLPYLSKELLMQVKNVVDLHGALFPLRVFSLGQFDKMFEVSLSQKW